MSNETLITVIVLAFAADWPLGYGLWCVMTIIWFERRRREYLASYARQHGWSYRRRQRPTEFSAEPLHEHLVPRGGRLTNILQGAVSIEPFVGEVSVHEVIAADLWEKGKLYTRTSFLAVRAPIDTERTLIVRPRRLVDDIAATLLVEQIKLESSEFNDRFQVLADSRRTAFDVLQPRVMELLLASSPPWVEFRSGWLFVTPLQATRRRLHADAPNRKGGLWLSDYRWQRQHVIEKIEWAHDFLSRLPRHLQSIGT